MNPRADKVDFTGVRWGSVEWTLLVTLYLRARESRLEQPILGDTAAAEAVHLLSQEGLTWRGSVKAVRPE